MKTSGMSEVLITFGNPQTQFVSGTVSLIAFT